ncbi:MAG TPA: hypothetical protein VH353_11980 [Caulobacteraceae bacterium]|jgi:hypothetical protein|nr:hypothetical protein [Caulobacteraceae bacterium]
MSLMLGGNAREAPPPPRLRLSVGITGHRHANAAFAANQTGIEETVRAVFSAIDGVLAATPALLGPGPASRPRLHSLLAEGADQLAAALALERGWDLSAPLPFGRQLNRAINALPQTHEEARFLLTGEGGCGPATLARASRIRALEQYARLFELADRDEAIEPLFLGKMCGDPAAAEAYASQASERVSLATQVMIEHSDLVVGVWDGATSASVGGTGHTIALALELGAPVIWIDAREPAGWRILTAPESLAAIMGGARAEPDDGAALARIIEGALRPLAGKAADPHGRAAKGLQALHTERWRPRSSRFWHAYRRVEVLFGARGLSGRLRSLTQVYESPEEIAYGSAALQIAAEQALPGQDAAFVARVRDEVLRRFAWADGVSSRLSDAYRGGMVLSFVFSALAVIAGVAYLPFATHREKWVFALVEFGLLAAILAVTFVGQRRRWHGRWFETRRVAEYFRHAPILLLLGVGRPTGRWPRGTETSWPEWYARHGLRDLGLPRVRVSADYLRGALEGLLLVHVIQQRDYHRAKAERLARAHHGLDRLSEVLFVLAVVSVGSYLVLAAAAAVGLVGEAVPLAASPFTTFLGVLLPVSGAAIASIRYFGDFERFSAISEVTAEKLDAVAGRIGVLLAAPEGAIDYARVSDLAHAADDIVVSEIENWQAVFGGKHITVPV